MSKESTWTKPEILSWKTAERGFWFNNVTQESTWVKPKALGTTMPDGSRYFVVNGEPTWEAPEEFAWRAVPSQSHDGRFFFENTMTKVVTWDRPAALGWSRRSVDQHYYWNHKSGAVQNERPEALGFLSKSGETYYVDPKTGASTWTPPAHAAWKEATSEKHSRSFWFNSITKDTVWEQPESAAWVKYHKEL